VTRRFPAQPIVSVGAVVVDGGRVLLARRGHEPLKGEWSLPGGVVEVGETLEAAVAREALEETGITVSVGAVVDVLDRIHTIADGRVEFHYVIVDYLCRPVGSLDASAGSDADDVRWVPEDALDGFALTEKAAAVVRRAFAMSREEATRPR
jgi:8-oxo-dGTP diphosphatase